MAQRDPLDIRPGLHEKDPGALFGAIGASASAAIALLVSFGIDISADQQAAILGIIAVLGPLLTALGIRYKAYAPVTHRNEMTELARELVSPIPPTPPTGPVL